jgi:hypothetical protein
MNYLEEMFVTLVLVLMAFFILLRLAQVMVGGFSKFKSISAKSALPARANWGD